MCAEKVAREFNISRVDQDKFSLRSQEKALKAIEAGALSDEITPIKLPLKKGEKEHRIFSVDEHPRNTSLEKLSKLKGVVSSEGTITAGNASGINDGAVATLIASEEMIKKYNLKPLARIKGAIATGVRPEIMGIGPVPAEKALLSRYKLQTKDIGYWELNEAFASQCLAVMRSLELADDASNVNIHGGAIAFGHPLGASGARITLHAARVLAQSTERYAIASMCVGVGQGSTILLERV
ncbi:MAG: thiolase family protein [Candidatus Caldatribacteriota bacterium]